MRTISIHVKRRIDSIQETKALLALLGEIFLLRLNCMLDHISFIVIPETPEQGRFLMFHASGAEAMQILHHYPKITLQFKTDTDNEEEAATENEEVGVARRPAKRIRTEEPPLFPMDLSKEYVRDMEFELEKFKILSSRTC